MRRPSPSAMLGRHGGRLLVAALAGVLAAPQAASAHSILRQSGAEISYTSADATSLNTLTVRPAGSEIEFRDPTVDGGMDQGTCRPGETDANAFVVQAFCPDAGVRLVRIDLGEREDRLESTLAIAVQALGGAGADDLRTGAGDDTLAGGTGDDGLEGGAGADSLTGGDGNDLLVGGDGDDQIQAGAGADRLNGGGGDDVLRARDGVRDTVLCGDGADRVEADDQDELPANAGCETVERTPSSTAPPPSGSGSEQPSSGGSPPPGGGTSSPGGNPGRSDTQPPVLRVGALTRQRVLRSRRVTFLARSSEPGSIAASGRLVIDGLAVPIRTMRSDVRVAGGGVRLHVRFSKRRMRAIRRALRRRRPVVVVLAIVATDAAGNSRAARELKVRVSR